MSTLTVSAASVDAPYTVGTWRGFTTAAVSYTFDDGCANQFPVAIPMFNKKKFKLTLFIVISGGMFPGWQKLISAAADGHEIASHTVSHGSLKSMANTAQENELKRSQDSINAHIPGKQCITLAYPYCETGNEALCGKYYIASRTCSGQINDKSPSNFNQISSILCGSTTSTRNSVSGINAGADDAAKSGGWCVYLFHGVGNDGGYSGVSENVLQGCVDYMDANRKKFWVESFGNVARYIKERNAVIVKEESATENSFTLKVTDGLDDVIYNYPLSIRRPLPAKWEKAEVTQDGKPVEFSLKDSAGVKYVTFDVIPDRGTVIISSGAVSNRNVNLMGNGKILIQPLKLIVNNMQITVPVTGIGIPVAVSFFNPAGKKIAASNLNHSYVNTAETALPSFSLPAGMCIVRVSDGFNICNSTCLVR